MNGERWSEEENDLLSQMKCNGCGYKRISRTLDRTRDAVRSRWREMIGDGRANRYGDTATESARRQARRLRRAS
jgi:hypothetical protein